MHVIRPRALIGGLFCGVLLCAITPFADSYLKTTPLAGGHFPLAAFFIFIASAVFFALLAKISRRPPLLSGMELLTAWALMVVVSGIGFTGLVRTFFINISAPAHFADTSNGWADSLLPLLPLYAPDPFPVHLKAVRAPHLKGSRAAALAERGLGEVNSPSPRIL